MSLAVIVAASLGTAFLATYLDEKTWPFGILMVIPTMLCGTKLVSLIYEGHFKPITLISLATIFWYFAPLVVLTLGIPGFTISANASVLSKASSNLVAGLIIASPLVLLEARHGLSFFKPLLDLSKNPPYILLFAFTMIQLFLIAGGIWTYGSVLMASTRPDAGGVVALLRAVDLCATAAMPMTAFFLGIKLASRGRLTSGAVLLCGFALLIGLIWHFISGRRYLTVEIVLCAVLYLAARYRLQGKKLKVTGVGRIAILVAGVIVVAWPVYFAVRVASYTSKNSGEMPGIVDLVTSATEVKSQDLEAGYNQKVIDRSAIILSYSAVQSTLRSFAIGQGLLVSVAMASPPFIVDKSKLPGSPEKIWASLGVPEDDYSNTLALDSYVDFGYIGYAVYLLIAVLPIYFIVLLFRFRKLPSSVVQISSIFLFLNTETSVTGYLVFARNVSILAIILFAIGSLGRRRRGSGSQRPGIIVDSVTPRQEIGTQNYGRQGSD
ncbi:hypothetical protein PX554_22680 [Sphingomonas sp. H39-1-10]|uniref:hypothetical protein n=1 Tax=Sphingomonas pollutisoli TaxID=3030829 RepID=UPI0023B93915|nr:hypothetical protein [Sphingomonas pollutisoli]MDF0490936.1 hypothetical protein [Sphingomonas pollutisoli]